MIEFRQECLMLCEEEVAPLAALEWEESGHPTESLCIDWDQYAALENVGMLKFFTARDGSTLIGYTVVIVMSPLTTKGSPVFPRYGFATYTESRTATGLPLVVSGDITMTTV